MKNQETKNYSLLTESWIEITDLSGGHKSVGLIELFNNAHQYEKLNFSMPGYDLAVLRFLIALVYIVAPPVDKKEWKTIFERGKFNKEFLDGLKKYEERLYLFHPKNPFMQEINLKEVNLTSIYKLYKVMPGATSSLHFLHYEYNLENCICSKCAIPALLATQLFANSSGIAPKENNQSRSYLAGINGSSPIYMLLKGVNLFQSIILNTLNLQTLSMMAEQKEMGVGNDWKDGFGKDFIIQASDVNIVNGYLWKPRVINLFKEENIENKNCIICNSISEFIIKGMNFRAGKYKIDDKTYWNDPMTAKVYKDDGTKTRAMLVGGNNAEKSGWKDYATLIYRDKRIKKGNEGEKVYERFIPLIFQEITKYQIDLLAKSSIYSLIAETPSQPQIKKYLNGEYEFATSLVMQDENQQYLKEIVQITEQAERALIKSLFIAYADKGNFKISEKYWKGLENNFNYILNNMIFDNNDYNPTDEWKKILIMYLRKLFDTNTKNLISINSKFKDLEKGKSELEKYIFFNLKEKEVKTNEKSN